MEYVIISTPQQIAELSEMGGRIFGEYYTSRGMMSAEQSVYMIDMFFSEEAIGKQIAKGYEYYFFYEEDRRIGFCAVHASEGKLFLSKLYFEESERGKGYGKEAMKFLEGLCYLQMLNAIWLTVNRENKDSIEFYLRRGFKILRSEDNEIGQGFFMYDYILELPIKPLF